MSAFLIDELKTFNANQLRRLADYYGVKYNSVTNKTELIQRLMVVIGTTDSNLSTEVEGKPMSVRVRRAYESQKGV